MTTDERHDDLRDRLRTHATPLATTRPDAPPGPLAPVGDALADATVVGLGEATHRTREFAQWKHRLVRYLVTERDLRLVALEAPFSEAMALHDYVVHGDGDAESALSHLGFSIHEVHAVVDFLEWLRSFNADRPFADRVAVYGIDVQSAAGAADALLDYFAADATPSLDADRRRALATVADGVFEGADVDERRLETADAVADDVEAVLDDAPDDAEPDEAAPRSPGPDRTLARQHLRTLRRACEFARTGLDADRLTQWGLRDEYMAATVGWLLSYDPADRAAVWAHDNHVKRDRMAGEGHPTRTMGHHLGDRFGEGYYALGTQFATGAVRPLVPVDDGDFEIDGQQYARRAVPVPEPEPGSVPARLSQVDAPVAFLDYRSLPDGRLRTWFAQQRRHRFVAGSVDPDATAPFDERYDAVAGFDGVLFVREATPTTPL